MKVKFLATGMAPTRYSFNGEVVTAHHNGQAEDFDLSGLQNGDQLQGVGVDVLGLHARHVIRNAYRDEQGELHVTLHQKVIASQYPDKKAHWREGPEMDAAVYDPSVCHVVPTGMAGVSDYAIVKGLDVSGEAGWTVIKGGE